ncbi:MAG: uracil-DNA glycosylase [Alphaproteobacteria bacterium]|nr:uracil-DNA glycosylase [Alphaproteobacteria bacterium]
MAERAPQSPARHCPRCPRLVEFRAGLRVKEPDWHNAPVPSFGPLDARLLILGLAPGLKGANRTGRPFTGDHAGRLLYATLLAEGFATGGFAERADDGLRLIDCRIANAVRCVPPANKPLPAEIASCRPFLEAELAAMPRLRVIVALGQIAHGAVLACLGLKPASHGFAHGARHPLPEGRVLLDSYHCSRQNTNTGRLTEPMFRAIFVEARLLLDAPVP